MPLRRPHRPFAVPAIAGLGAVGLILAAGDDDWGGLSGGFCGTMLVVLALVIAAGVVLDLLLLSHADRHRY